MVGLLVAARPPATVDDLGWLAGDWASEAGGRWTEESWTAPRGGVMLGVSRSGRGEVLRDYEFIRIAPGDLHAVIHRGNDHALNRRQDLKFRIAQRNLDAIAVLCSRLHPQGIADFGIINRDNRPDILKGYDQARTGLFVQFN